MEPAATAVPAAEVVAEQQEVPAACVPNGRNDEVYFNSYADLAIHQEMLSDFRRTDAYRRAIEQQPLHGKVVLDVGCGTGVLAIFAAHAGAARASAVIRANNLSNVITIIHGRVEDVELPEQVDCIISEWMGYCLLYECMLPSVLVARNRWLKTGGAMMPASATLLLAPFTDEERYTSSSSFWLEDIHGINMSVLEPYARHCAFAEPIVDAIAPEQVLSWPCKHHYTVLPFGLMSPFRPPLDVAQQERDTRRH
eukprot:jgi/Chlat1/6316/Chrsp44S05883